MDTHRRTRLPQYLLFARNAQGVVRAVLKSTPKGSPDPFGVRVMVSNAYQGAGSLEAGRAILADVCPGCTITDR